MTWIVYLYLLYSPYALLPCTIELGYCLSVLRDVTMMPSRVILHFKLPARVDRHH